MLATDTHETVETSYPSPPPSARAACSTSSQTPAGLGDTTASGPNPKNAREYWGQYWSERGLHKPSSGKKRKNQSGDANRDRGKKRQKTKHISPSDTIQTGASLPEGVSDDNGSSADAPESGDTPALSSSLDLFSQEELMQLLGQEVDANDSAVRDDLRQLYNAALSFGHGKCKLVGGKWVIDGFGTPLFPHQLIGVSWMLMREFHPTGPRGGILADEMGLGKTAQVLACMSQNPPRKKSSVTKTLVIAPKRLISQWFNEIMKHCSQEKMRSVCIYAGAGIGTQAQLEQATIILTNYEQIHRQLPAPAKLREVEDLKLQGDPTWKDLLREFAGPLFRVNWYRVVLDEAHYINNRSSQTSRACRLLIRKHGWALTGTPMTNNTDEFFPYLDFLRTGHGDFGVFRDVMGDMSNDQQKETLKRHYRQITLGRWADEKLMGREILQLPSPRMILVTVEFSALESSMYQQIRDQHNQLREQAKARRGTGGDKRGSAVPKGELNRLFNHLRFFTAHPALVEKNYFAKQEAQPEAAGHADSEPDTATIQCFCRTCRKVLVQPMIAQCGHAFCQECLKKNRPCPSCGSIPSRAEVKPGGDECYHHDKDQFENLLKQYADCGLVKNSKRRKLCRRAGEDEFGLQPRFAQERNTTTKGKGKNKRKATASKGNRKGGRGKGKKGKKDVTVEQTRTNARSFLQACDKEPWNTIPHSAKSRATMDLVKKWQEEAPNDKIIIFAQWIPVLALLGRMIFQSGFRFVYLYGEMAPEAQEMAIRAFHDIPETKIMLIYVTCGAHGLNLTAANRVIIYDHWWHEGWERQAFARVRRIGQIKEIHLAKLVAAKSMDEHILAMQDEKRKTIGSAIGYGPVQPQFHEIMEVLCKDGVVDQELLELTRLDDINDDDEESDSGDDDDASGSDSDSDSDSGSSEYDSDDDDDEASDSDETSSSEYGGGSEDEASDDE